MAIFGVLILFTIAASCESFFDFVLKVGELESLLIFGWLWHITVRGAPVLPADPDEEEATPKPPSWLARHPVLVQGTVFVAFVTVLVVVGWGWSAGWFAEQPRLPAATSYPLGQGDGDGDGNGDGKPGNAEAPP
ncbi:MAG TPA: hypothetical protein VKA46_31745 [Gemmataceae bacterium]|nr:hypothetical protein [Gemmataceae bacterium]